ncbi:hypothetical protein FB107DRAFT_174834, partial [Schizophyllum commune]
NSANCFKCGRRGHWAKDCRSTQSDSGNQNSRNQRGSNNSGNRQSRGRGRSGKSNAHIAMEDDDEDFGFLTRDPTIAQGLSPDDWLVDSGCSRPIVRNKSSFTLYRPDPGHRINGLSNAEGIGRGTAPLSFALGTTQRACMIRDAIHCPSAPFNLVSVSRTPTPGIAL